MTGEMMCEECGQIVGKEEILYNPRKEEYQCERCMGAKKIRWK